MRLRVVSLTAFLLSSVLVSPNSAAAFSIKDGLVNSEKAQVITPSTTIVPRSTTSNVPRSTTTTSPRRSTQTTVVRSNSGRSATTSTSQPVDSSAPQNNRTRAQNAVTVPSTLPPTTVRVTSPPTTVAPSTRVRVTLPPTTVAPSTRVRVTLPPTTAASPPTTVRVATTVPRVTTIAPPTTVRVATTVPRVTTIAPPTTVRVATTVPRVTTIAPRVTTIAPPTTVRVNVPPTTVASTTTVRVTVPPTTVAPAVTTTVAPAVTTTVAPAVTTTVAPVTTTTVAPVTTTTVAPDATVPPLRVTYDGNSPASGSVPVDASSYASGSSVTVAGNVGTLTKTGYTFAAWCTTRSADGSACAGTSLVAASTFAVTSDTTLYAQWTANTLTVTYDSQSGSAISLGSTTTGGSISSSPGTPTRSGYTFNGWFTAASGGSAITFAHVHGQTANFTLYAQWTANTLTVTYDSQSGSAISLGSTTTGGSISSSPGTPTRSGYTFNGWFTAASGGSAITYAYVHGQTANFTLYAQWTGATCANGGACVVGDTGPGGGKVFYVAPTTFVQTNASGTMCTTACKYLEYAPLNWGTTLSAISGCTAGTATTDPKCKYVLTSLTVTTPVTSLEIGAGYNNTLLILTSNSSPAARAASSYRGSGFTDWFLPSAKELFELCKYATVQTSSGGTSCSGGNNGQTTYLTVVRSEFTENGSGNLAQYWTSSRASHVTTAYFGNWRYQSTSATDNNLGQNQALHMRAIRAFG